MATKNTKMTVSSMYGTTGKPRTTRAKKMIDLTKEMTPAPVERYVNLIKNALVKSLKASNIPVLMQIAKSPRPIDGYFLNRDLYRTVLGDNLKCLDRIMRGAITEIVSASVYDTIVNSGEKYPGTWDAHTIYSLTHMTVNISTLSDYPTCGEYLSAGNQDETDKWVTKYGINGIPAVLCMRFSQYNANRLYQFCSGVEKATVNLIMNEIRNNIPSAYLCTKYDTIQNRFALEIGDLLIEAKPEILHLGVQNKDAHVEHFCTLFDSVFLGYVTVCLNQSGLNRHLVEAMLDASKLNISYNVSREDQPWWESTVSYALTPANKDYASYAIGAVFTISDLYAMMDHEKVKKNQMNRVGKEIKAFIEKAIAYAINGVAHGYIKLSEVEDGATEVKDTDEK